MQTVSPSELNGSGISPNIRPWLRNYEEEQSKKPVEPYGSDAEFYTRGRTRLYPLGVDGYGRLILSLERPEEPVDLGMLACRVAIVESPEHNATFEYLGGIHSYENMYGAPAEVYFQRTG